MTKDDKKEGTVKFFENFRNFGFISGDDGKDYFVHGPTGIIGYDKGKIIKEGDRVSFKTVMGDKGPKAESVELIKKEEKPKEKEETKKKEPKSKKDK